MKKQKNNKNKYIIVYYRNLLLLGTTFSIEQQHYLTVLFTMHNTGNETVERPGGLHLDNYFSQKVFFHKFYKLIQWNTLQKSLESSICLYYGFGCPSLWTWMPPTFLCLGLLWIATTAFAILKSGSAGLALVLVLQYWHWHRYRHWHRHWQCIALHWWYQYALMIVAMEVLSISQSVSQVSSLKAGMSCGPVQTLWAIRLVLCNEFKARCLALERNWKQ